MRVRLGCHTTMRVMVMFVAPVLAADLELCRADSCALHALGPDCVTIDGQAPERGTDVIKRDTCIDQRADDHVTRRTGEAVEVQNLHNPSILLDTTGKPARFNH